MMVIEWKEREHEEVDVVVERDLRSKQALKICGLYKFWSIKGMRAQVRLLQTLLNNWNLEIENVNLDGQPLRIEVNNIYFIAWLYFLVYCMVVYITFFVEGNSWFIIHILKKIQ
jgi:hypothetical protein